MNKHHMQVCPSPEWAEMLQTTVLPQVSSWAELGDEILELGPGPGAATDWLRHRVRRLVAVEYEADAATALAQRFAGTNVEVVHGDATDLAFPDESFDVVAAFTMLHHVPTVELQNRLLAQALRVLRPGGALLGSDSLPGDGLHHRHEGDTYNPVEPAVFLVRLQTLGFERITLSVDDRLKFAAHKPRTAGESAPPVDHRAR